MTIAIEAYGLDKKQIGSMYLAGDRASADTHVERLKQDARVVWVTEETKRSAPQIVWERPGAVETADAGAFADVP